MRRAKIDANQPDIVAALRAAGCTVQSLATIGNGCPDLLVGRAGGMVLIEVKDGSKVPSAQKLTPDQVKWLESWRGPAVIIARSVDDALAAAP